MVDWLLIVASLVEVRLTKEASTSFKIIRKLVYQYIRDNYDTLFFPTVVSGWEASATLRNSVERIVVSEDGERSHLHLDAIL